MIFKIINLFKYLLKQAFILKINFIIVVMVVINNFRYLRVSFVVANKEVDYIMTVDYKDFIIEKAVVNFREQTQKMENSKIILIEILTLFQGCFNVVAIILAFLKKSQLWHLAKVLKQIQYLQKIFLDLCFLFLFEEELLGN